MINKKISAFIFALITFAVFFTACKSMPESKNAMMGMEKMEMGKELAPWKGEWVSADIVRKSNSLKAAYGIVAESMPYYTADGLEAAMADMYATPVSKAKFDGTNTVIFTIKTKDGKEIEKACKYKYVGQAADPQYPESVWATFEAEETMKELSNVKYFIALMPHSHGEGVTHWHARFSSYSIKWLVEGDTTWPTYYPASTSKADLIKMYEDSIKAMPKYLPAEPLDQYAKFGKWVNSLSIYDNKSKEVEAVYAKLIKEFAGKNPKGGDFTKAELIAELKKSNDSWKDFSHIEFITKGGKNELVVYKDGKETFRSTYKRVAASASRPYITMKADKKDAGKYSIISFVVVHGAPNHHFHLWYGASEEELKAQKGTPTCYVYGKPNNVIASQIEKSIRRMIDASNK